MPSLPPAPALEVETIGRTVREAEAALCRIHHAATVLLAPRLAKWAEDPLHALGLARAASVGLVDDTEPFYLAPPAALDGPECLKAAWLPEAPREVTLREWDLLRIEVEAAGALLAELSRAFARHVHVEDRWSDVTIALDYFSAAALVARYGTRAPRRRKSKPPRSR